MPPFLNDFAVNCAAIPCPAAVPGICVCGGETSGVCFSWCPAFSDIRGTPASHREHFISHGCRVVTAGALTTVGFCYCTEMHRACADAMRNAGTEAARPRVAPGTVPRFPAKRRFFGKVLVFPAERRFFRQSSVFFGKAQVFRQSSVFSAVRSDSDKAYRGAGRMHGSRQSAGHFVLCRCFFRCRSRRHFCTKREVFVCEM